MKSVRTTIVIVLITIFLLNCGTNNSVNIRSFSPKDEVNKLSTFTIEFDEPLAPADIQNKWIEEEFIKFSPKIEGKFKWTSATTLLFSPDNPLKPMQRYKAEITSKVLFNTTFEPDFDSYEFYTPLLNVSKAEFFWNYLENNKNSVSIQSNIYFNYPVNPNALKEYLKVKLNNQVINNWELVSQATSDILAINIGEISQTTESQKIEIEILAGLKSIVAKTPLEESKSFTYKLEPISKLAIKDVTSGVDGDKVWIEISTTQSVDDKKLSEYISLTPNVSPKFYVTNNQIRIEGNFKDVNSVNLLIKKGLPGKFGGELQFDYEQLVSLVSLEPDITFENKSGKYLMLSGAKNILANIVNIDEVDIEISKIYKNNLVHFLTRNSYYYYENNYGYKPYFDTYGLGQLVYSSTKKLQNGNNWVNKEVINLSEALESKYKGIFLVKMLSSNDRWRSDSKIVAVSNLGIIAKYAKNSLLVFVNSISDTKAVKSAKVEIRSSNNQVLASATTDENGVAKFSNVQNQFAGFTPSVITVDYDNDFNFLDLRESRVELSRYDIDGIYSTTDYFTYIYAERNLYRPGEKINISAIVRNRKYANVKDIPVILKVISPTGKVFDEFKKTLNSQGSLELGFELPSYAQTGEYNIELYTGSKQLLNTYRISVEDFVPDKLRLILKSDKENVSLGEWIKTEISSQYLFGSPASKLKYEADVQLRNDVYKSSKFKNYNFSNSSIKTTTFPNQFFEGQLSDSGKAIINYLVPTNLSAGGIIAGNTFVSVFDPTGRTINRRLSFKIFPKKYFIGIENSDYYYATNSNLKFRFCAVDQNDKLINGFEGSAKLIRYEWKTVLKKDNSNRFFYQSEKTPIVEWTKDIVQQQSPGVVSLTLTHSGEYELQISKKGESSYQRKTFYAYSWGSTTASSFQVNKEGSIDIVSDKKKYEANSKAKLLFKTPFEGKMLVTIERDTIFNYQYVDVKEKSTELEIDLPEKYLPNVYVSATLFKPHTNEETSPFLVAHGIIPLKIENSSHKLNVEILASKNVKPNTKQNITIKTNGGLDTYVTLAVVDEGILQIKNYKSPDPYNYMYSKRGLQVESYDLYKLLLPEIKKAASSSGGDALAAELQKRTNPIKSNRFKLVSIWSGIRHTDNTGKTSLSIDIPQYNGELRLMAVAYKDKKFGYAESKLKVADDLIIEPQIPRFLAPNDVLTIPITIINTTNQVKNVTLSLATEGALLAATKLPRSISIEPKKNYQTNFVVTAKNLIGQSKISINVSGDCNITNTYNIPVRPVSPLITKTDIGTIKDNSEISLNLNNNYIKETAKGNLAISKMPTLRYADKLKNLVTYPYGCVEQTVSKVFPLIYFDELSRLAAPKFFRDKNPLYFVNEGIKKLESMQLYDGSLSYWPGGYTTSWWGSVYAAHFLVEAKSAGFNVNQKVLNNLLRFIEKRSTSKETYDYVRYVQNRKVIKRIVAKEIPYSIYVLALAGKSDLSTMNYYKSRLDQLSSDSKYLLAGAYALSGNWEVANNLLPNAFTEERTDKLTGGNFDSEIRANAIMLSTLLKVDPSNLQIPYIVKYLSENSKIDYYSTQELAWTLMALGKAAKINSNSNLEVVIFSNGKEIGKYNGEDISLELTSEDLANGIKIKSSGTGQVYYYAEAEGISLDAEVKDENSNMKITREYFDYKTGNKIFNGMISQGQLLVCKVSLTGYARSAANVVIADLIPAGLEIENPRLNPSTSLNWSDKNLMPISYQDIRDDRLILFTNLSANKTTNYYYMLRAVNQGEFSLPAIGAEAMYNKEFHSYNGASKVTISE